MDSGYCSVYFRRLAGVGVMTAVMATAFVPAMAAPQAQPDGSSAFSKKSIAKVVANSAPDGRVRTDRNATAEAKTPAQATSSGSFFKTRTGALVLVVMAVGTGYAVYSASNDRIKGINR